MLVGAVDSAREAQKRVAGHIERTENVSAGTQFGARAQAYVLEVGAVEDANSKRDLFGWRA